MGAGPAAAPSSGGSPSLNRSSQMVSMSSPSMVRSRSPQQRSRSPSSSRGAAADAVSHFAFCFWVESQRELHGAAVVPRTLRNETV